MSTLIQHQMVEISTELDSVRTLLARVESQQASLLHHLTQQEISPAASTMLVNDFYATSQDGLHVYRPAWQGRLGDDYVATLIGTGRSAL